MDVLDFHAYVTRVLRATVAELGWHEVGPEYAALQTATLEAYGVAPLAEATDGTKLRALAQREAWRAVLAEAVALVDRSDATGSSAKYSQLSAHAKAMFDRATAEAAPYLPVSDATLTGIRRSQSTPLEVVW